MTIQAMTGHPSGEREPLSHVDAAWLRMDSATNPMVITAALMFDGAVPFEAFEASIRERLLPHRRFRERVVEPTLPFGVPMWEPDACFDVRAHVHHVRLPEPADHRAFETFIGDLMSSPLPRDRPLWQAHVVDDAPRGRTALVVRLHHCIGDGVSLVWVLLSLSDAHMSEPTRVGLAAPHPPEDLLALGKRARDQAATLGRLLLLPEDPPSPLKAPLSRQKRVAWTESIPLSDVKRVGHALTGTTNDVLQSCVAGALRRYLIAHHGLPEGRELRALVPVFIQDQGTGLGNHFGLVFLSLPLHVSDARDRVRETKRRMDEIKHGDDATVAFAVLDAMGVASAQLEHIALEIFTRKASLLTTNVPGPPAQCRIADHGVEAMLVWAPVAGYVGLGFTLHSYAGSVRACVASDEHVVKEPAELARAFEDELRELIGMTQAS